MPRQSERSRTTRRIITDQETFDYSTPNLKVSANPVDAFARPARGISGSAAALMQAFQTGGEILKERADFKNQQDYEAGGVSHAKGEQRDDSKSAAWLTGYEAMKGEAEAADLNDALRQFHTEHWQDDPETYSKGRETIMAGFLDGKSKAYLKSFVPQAVKLEEHFTNKYQEAQLGQLQEDIKTNTGKAIRGFMDGIAEDPEAMANSPKLIRAKLSEWQASAKPFGLSRTAVSLQAVQHIGMRAILDGMPELMLFTSEPDESGMTLADNPELAPEILSIVRQAENARDGIKAAQAKQEKDNQERIGDALERAIIEGYYTGNPADRTKRLELQTILTNAGAPDRNEFGVALKPERLEHYWKLANDLNGGGQFAQTSNPIVWQDLWIKAAEGKLDIKELNENQPSLTRDEAAALVKENSSARSRAKSGDGNPFDPMFKQQLTDLLAVINPKNSMGGDLFKKGPKRAMDARQLAYAWYLDKVKTNGAPPTLEENHKFLETLAEKYTKDNPFSVEPPAGGATKRPSKTSGTEAPTGSRMESIKDRLERVKAKKGE